MSTALPSAFAFGLAFGSLIFVRALLDRTPHNIGVTVVMFLFFAGVAGVTYVGMATVVRKRPMAAAALTALLLLLVVSAPAMLSAPLHISLSPRIAGRLAAAWIYVSLLFAALGRMVGVKTLGIVLALCASLPATAQFTEEFAPPKAGCCLQFSARALAEQLQDWNQLGRYHADNQRLLADTAPAGRVVFLGDSITDGWKLAEAFPGKPYVNRGISGQTTPQMLVRMYPDVISLKPAALVLLAGTNDLARNTGPVTQKMVEDNVRAISELAKIHGIKMILCALLPVSDYTPRKQTAGRPPAQIVKLNAWLRQYARETGAEFVDYHGATADKDGFLPAALSGDGLHPNGQGYAVMAPLVEAAIARALRQ